MNQRDVSTILAELQQWLSGSMSHWNRMQVSDIDTWTALTAQADAAHIIGLSAELNALIYLEQKESNKDN